METLTLQGLTGAHPAGNQLINNYRKFLLAYERQHRPRDLPAPPVSEARPWLASRRDVRQAEGYVTPLVLSEGHHMHLLLAMSPHAHH